MAESVESSIGNWELIQLIQLKIWETRIGKLGVEEGLVKLGIGVLGQELEIRTGAIKKSDNWIWGKSEIDGIGQIGRVGNWEFGKSGIGKIGN